MTEITVIQCPKCLDIIFSRAHHDFHHCSCGDCFIDGGFDYTRYGWNEKYPQPKAFKMKINKTKKELYDDWNYRKGKYGIIKTKKEKIKKKSI